jgi:hypothetical protein
MAVNLITNFGFETNTTGWTPVGTSVFARTTAEFHAGVASLHATFDGLTAFPTVTTGVGSGFPAAGLVRANVGIWLKGTGTLNLIGRATVNGFAANRDTTLPISLTASWAYYSVTAASQAGDTVDAFHLHLADFSGATLSADLYADDADITVIESGAYTRIRSQFELRPY